MIGRLARVGELSKSLALSRPGMCAACAASCRGKIGNFAGTCPVFLASRGWLARCVAGRDHAAHAGGDRNRRNGGNMACRTLDRWSPPGDDIRALHIRLNQLLPKTMDQLPESGDGANNFGPRTEAKVKAFQKKYKIDLGTKDYMDGRVGPHTYHYLNMCVDVDIGVFRRPPLMLPNRP